GPVRGAHGRRDRRRGRVARCVGGSARTGSRRRDPRRLRRRHDLTGDASVLLVEDDKVAAVALRSALVRAGYHVEVASNVDEALGLFVPSTFDVVVTDLVMPGRSGLDLLRHVDRSEPLLPVIIVTGDQSVQAAAEAVRGDAFDYLTKPVSGEELLDAVG